MGNLFYRLVHRPQIDPTHKPVLLDLANAVPFFHFLLLEVLRETARFADFLEDYLEPCKLEKILGIFLQQAPIVLCLLVEVVSRLVSRPLSP